MHSEFFPEGSNWNENNQMHSELIQVQVRIWLRCAENTFNLMYFKRLFQSSS